MEFESVEWNVRGYLEGNHRGKDGLRSTQMKRAGMWIPPFFALRLALRVCSVGIVVVQLAFLRGRCRYRTGSDRLLVFHASNPILRSIRWGFHRHYLSLSLRRYPILGSERWGCDRHYPSLSLRRHPILGSERWGSHRPHHRALPHGRGNSSQHDQERSQTNAPPKPLCFHLFSPPWSRWKVDDAAQSVYPLYWKTLFLGLTVAGIGTGLMNGSDSKPFWEKGKPSQPPFIRKGKRLPVGSRMPVRKSGWLPGDEPYICSICLYQINVNRYLYVSCSSFKPLVRAG